jgi:hypothetical protein
LGNDQFSLPFTQRIFADAGGLTFVHLNRTAQELKAWLPDRMERRPRDAVPAQGTCARNSRELYAEVRARSFPAAMLRAADGMIRWGYAFVDRAGHSD